MTDFERHYSDFIECDWCGRATRGRIYSEDPLKVRCGSCNRTIAYIVSLPDLNLDGDDD